MFFHLKNRWNKLLVTLHIQCDEYRYEELLSRLGATSPAVKIRPIPGACLQGDCLLTCSFSRVVINCFPLWLFVFLCIVQTGKTAPGIAQLRVYINHQCISIHISPPFHSPYSPIYEEQEYHFRSVLPMEVGHACLHVIDFWCTVLTELRFRVLQSFAHYPSYQCHVSCSRSRARMSAMFALYRLLAGKHFN